MSDAKQTEELANRAADAVREVIASAESRAQEIIRDAEAKAASIRDQAEAEAAQIRERGEKEARGQIEAAKRALDELGGTLAAAASSALPKSEAETRATEPEPEPEPEQAEPEQEPAETPGAPASPSNGDDAAERLAAMKLAVEGKDRAAIEAELTEKFGEADRSALLDDVLSRTTG
ncbi:MAG TPA: hypothetical protein VGF31_01585 [Myxococcaceae bacterium]